MNNDPNNLHGDDAGAYGDAYGSGNIDLGYDAELNGADLTGVPPVVQPRIVQPSGGVSYANAHHAQRLQGQVQPLAPRKPQAIQSAKHNAASANNAGAQGGQQAAPKPKLSSGTGTVKAVPTGDTVVVSFANGEEKTITLSGLSAPRVQRGPPRANDDKKAPEEEPFGWESKEFLRKLLLGRVVSFQIVNVAAGNREYGTVKIDDKNVAELIVAAGWAKVRESQPRKDGKPHPERAALGDLQTAAQEAGLGLFAKDAKPEEHTRKVDWNPNTRHLYDKFKGQVLKGTIDRVMDGSTLRVELQSTDPKKPLQHSVITLYLAGVQAPQVPMPPRQAKPAAKKTDGADADDEDAPEPAPAPKPQRAQPAQPFAHEARAFVERLLLHRDVGAVIQGIDKAGRLFGSIVFHKGNISVELLKQGYANLVEWSAVLTSDPQALKDAERAAKAQRTRIWSVRPVSAAPEPSSDDEKSFTGKVVQVVSGDTVVVVDGNNRTRRVVLASITAPRAGYAREQRESQPYAYESKEFLRQRLIGRKVKITVEYKRNVPAQGGGREEPREYVSIYAGKNNASISEELLAAGLATVVKHRLDEPRSSAYDALIAAENQALTRRLGLHDTKKKYTAPKFTDLTEKPRGTDEEKKAAAEAAAAAPAAGGAAANTLSARAKMLLSTLQRDPENKGIVEYVFSGTRLKVLLPKHEVLVSFLLAGVRCPAAPGANRNKKDDKGEPFGKEAIEFVRNLVMQQDVRLEVETMDKGDNFIGSVFVNRQNLALLLLDEGFASVFSASADRSKYSRELYEHEAAAKAAKKGIWKNWVPPAPKPEEPAEDKSKDAEAKELSPEEQFLNINVTEVVDGANFFVQIVGNQATSFIEEKMKNFANDAAAYAPGKYEPEKGATCAARFSDGGWHRVRIEGKTPDGFTVYFIDYGNHDTVKAEDLRPITDKSITAVAPLARQCTLAGCRAPTSKNEWFQAAREALLEYAFGQPMLAKVHHRDVQNRMHVTLHYSDRPDSVNQLLLRDGLVRIAERPHPRLKGLVQELRAEEKFAKDNHSCIWEYGDVSDEEEEAAPVAAGKGRPPKRN